jgi:acetyltransferase
VISGLQSFASVTKVPGAIDVAIITVPRDAVAEVLHECGHKRIPFVVIISAGFKEIGAEGAAKEQELRDIARKYTIRIVGPNCLGYMSPFKRLNASFAAGMPQQGNIALISQSGAMAVAMLDWAYQSHLGFSQIISIGNKTDVNELECMEYAMHDKHTKVIMLYLESIDDGRAFMQQAARITKKKPIIVLKAGASIKAKQAVNSHTGSLAGSEEAINAAFAQVGVIRAHTVEEFFDLGLAFSHQPLPKGNRIAVITNAGGPGIMAVDAAEPTAVQLPQLSARVQQRLRAKLPASANVKNPIDVIGDARSDRYAHALDVVLSSNEVDGAVVVVTPQVMTDTEGIARVIVAAQAKSRKPVLASIMGGVSVAASRLFLEVNSIPNFETPERAVRSMGKMIEYARQTIKPWVAPRVSTKKLPKAQGHIQIRTREVETLLHHAGLPVLQSVLLKTAKDCAKIQAFPVVMKIASRDVVHKAATGAVLLNITSVEEARKAFVTLTRNVRKAMPKAEIEGVLVQAQLDISDAREVIIGMKRDASFGPVVLFGVGGGLVEVFHDIACGIAPLTLADAEALVDSIRTRKLLDGYDVGAIARALVQVSSVSLQYPEIASLDMNPMLVFRKPIAGRGPQKHATIVDVRMLI